MMRSEGKVLIVIILITSAGWEYEADQRHFEFIAHEVGASGVAERSALP